MLLLTGCALLGGQAEREKIYGTAIPAITEVFASKQVSSGENWRVYINASDADGDMDQINFSIDQPGVFPAYPTAYTKVAQDQPKNLSGYIYLNTSGLERSINITLTLHIWDKAGHFSAPAWFPVSIVGASQQQKEIRQEDPPRGIFQDKSLGPIMIVLHSDVG